MNSVHWAKDRNERQEVINRLGGDGKEIFRSKQSLNDPRGWTWHVVTDNAIIIVINGLTNKTVTKMIARPNQLLRYGYRVPESVLEKARRNMRLGLNEI